MIKNSDNNKSKYGLNEAGEFIINDYNRAKPLASFFPGIAGVDGVPMWVFYVNRGQCISGMGVRDKDHSIMEFMPANRAYNLTGSHGFRTFIRRLDNSADDYYEPFQNYYRDRRQNRTQRMIIAPSHLSLEEVNHSINLKFRVEYFTVPQDKYAGLIRVLKIENLGSEPVSLEGLDGLPVMVPYGVDNFCLKNMRRTIEAFVEVCNLEKRVPFYKAKVEPADRPDVTKISEGNFYCGFEETEAGVNLVNPIVDAGRIFGAQSDLSYPENFLKISFDEITENQILENCLPCAMGIFKTTLAAGDSYNYTSIVGHATSRDKLNAMIPAITATEYIEVKSRGNRELIAILTQNNLICSNEPALDYYVRQNFLDNTMRGGFPVSLPTHKEPVTLYLYSRKHGDMERDYNDFSLSPTPYSQGNGNFRDINQNRRSDLFFNPDVGKTNVEYFYNLIQLDGYNPLILKESNFIAGDRDKLHGVFKKYVKAEKLQILESFVNEPFTPGELMLFLDENEISLDTNSDIFLGEVIEYCCMIPETEYGEGYWIDHWTYNLDLLENYVAVYPDKFRDLMLVQRSFSFYDNPYCVLARDDKYVLRDGKAMQLGAVRLDEEKARAIGRRESNRNQVRTRYGNGDIYYTTLFNKILCIIVNKLASLDPEGVGVEMEAGKPGWYDALNGLSGLFGSSISETLEIKRHIQFLLDVIVENNLGKEKTAIFEELHELIEKLDELLARGLTPLEFWQMAEAAKERYRQRIRLGVSGKEITVGIDRIGKFFEAALNKLDDGISRGWDENNNIIGTYFRYEVTDYEELEVVDSDGEKIKKCNEAGFTCIRPLKFRRIALPLFLEGPVHYLRCHPEMEKAREFAASVKKSDLYDRALKMYKVNASLCEQPMEIGRARVFSPGWLENESIWLHMEYKYMLELARNGLFAEFYDDFKKVFIPFLNPDFYGRSILENSSFLVSSAHPDKAQHGNGYVARLTGATAEFIHILLLLTVGARPFRLSSQGDLQLHLEPALPGWLFTEKSRNIELYKNDEWQMVALPAHTFSFMFMGKTLVTYHNDSGKDTFGDNGVRPAEWKIVDMDGGIETIEAEFISGEAAIKIRAGKVDKIDIMLR